MARAENERNRGLDMLRTSHKLIYSDSRRMSDIADESVDLIVTSPPYPMIEMWDSVFSSLNPQAGDALADGNGDRAFEVMHQELDKTWLESFRVLKQGGFACINIGDATRTIGQRFQLYSNHSRIVQAFKKIGFDTLPVILWRKQTNAPNKFMGSGTLPSGAYVTLEHEYVLIFRKGAKRVFDGEAKLLRQKSAFFWEERNKWFSDVWFDLKGVSQDMNHDGLRDRSAAFPFELAYRLVNMYSIQLDTVLDPFMGTGTTTMAAMASCRNSKGIEIDRAFEQHIVRSAIGAGNALNKRIRQRFSDHLEFVNQHLAAKGIFKHTSSAYRFPVITGQEVEMRIPFIDSISGGVGSDICVTYLDEAQPQEIGEVTYRDYALAREEPGQLSLSF
jgi:DNA modification methylase